MSACLPVDLAGELTAKIKDFQPDVIGISIRLVFGDELDPEAPLGTRHTDLRPRVKEMVDIVRQVSPARIVLGGPGFNYYARDWLEYLDLDYGIRGEGEEAFPLYLEAPGGGWGYLFGTGQRVQKGWQLSMLFPLPGAGFGQAGPSRL